MNGAQPSAASWRAAAVANLPNSPGEYTDGSDNFVCLDLEKVTDGLGRLGAVLEGRKDGLCEITGVLYKLFVVYRGCRRHVPRVHAPWPSSQGGVGPGAATGACLAIWAKAKLARRCFSLLERGLACVVTRLQLDQQPCLRWKERPSGWLSSVKGGASVPMRSLSLMFEGTSDRRVLSGVRLAWKVPPRVVVARVGMVGVVIADISE